MTEQSETEPPSANGVMPLRTTRLQPTSKLPLSKLSSHGGVTVASSIASGGYGQQRHHMQGIPLQNMQTPPGQSVVDEHLGPHTTRPSAVSLD